MKYAAKITKIIEGDSKIKANADVYLEGGFKVSGIKICQGQDELFLGMPSVPYTNSNGEKKYKVLFNPTTKEAREALTKEVLSKYRAALSQSQVQVQTEQNTPLPSEPDFGEPNFEDGFEDFIDAPSM